MGAITISMEIDLGWGIHDVPQSSHLSEDGAAERAYLVRKTAAGMAVTDGGRA